MKNSIVFTFLFLFVSLSSDLHSQGYFSYHFGPSFPLSDFASDDMDAEEASAASVGINIGLQYVYPLAETGFGVFGGFDFIYNGLKKDFKDDLEEYYEQTGIRIADIKHLNYFNVPLTAGLNYSFQADEKVGVFANVGLALNFFKISDMEIEANGQTFTNEFDLASQLGFKIGGGILFYEKASISIDYFGLGDYDIEGEIKTAGYSEEMEGIRKVDLLTLTLGIRF